MFATFLLGKPAVLNGKMVKHNWLSKKRAIFENIFLKTTQFKKHPVCEIISNR